MLNYIIFFISLFLTNPLRVYLLKKRILISLSGDNHQKYSNSTVVPLIGGLLIFILISNLYFFYIDSNFYYFLFFTLILGLSSDLKIFKSAFLKLLIQIFLIYYMVYFSDLKLDNIGINIIDNLNTNIIFNYIFVTFCIIIIINGSNFIDGMNGLSLGYFILILFILLKIEIFPFDKEINNFFLISLIIILFLNFKNLLFLGDNGSYSLGIFFSYILIKIYNDNNFSPFFVILLLWYPSFELLFSIIRKFNFHKSPMLPDTKHLHQLLYFYVLTKFKKNNLISNNLTSLIINFYNFAIFLLSSLFYQNSEIQIFLIIVSIIIYCILYRYLILWKLNLKFFKK